MILPIATRNVCGGSSLWVVHALTRSLLIIVITFEVCWSQSGQLDAEFAGAGARPLSMGGAFIGLADDSTAAEFNPAGIRILPRPEIAWQATRKFDKREEFLLKTSSLDPVFTTDRNQWTTPSFISYVHPGEKYTWAISQITTIDFVHRFDDPKPDFLGRTFFNKTEATNNSFGLTFATDLKPRLHFGVTLRMNRFEFRNDTSDFSSTGELTDWSPNINTGILWRATKNWSIGAVYKSSQEVKGEIRNGRVNTKLPETFGVGVAFHPNDEIRIVADVDYINWSSFDGDTGDLFRRNDVTRYHLGGEYLLSVNDDRAIFIRSGYMREDSNSSYYYGSSDFRRQAFPQKDDLDHLTAGFGIAREKYQIDFAVDHVLDGGTTLILAMIHYF